MIFSDSSFLNVLFLSVDLTIIVVSFCVSAIYFHRWIYGMIKGYARQITLGISLTTFGATLLNVFIFFSFCNRLEFLSFLLLIALGFILIGLAFHLYPFIEKYFESHGMKGYFIFVVILFLTIFQINSYLLKKS